MEWYTDLCEYYKVSPEEADDLGTRKKGRKPNLPGSATCEPVSGLTFEEIWKGKFLSFTKTSGHGLLFVSANITNTEPRITLGP